MSFTVYSYIVYLVVSVTLTIWVARTLHHRGRIFLIDAFHGNESVADSVNHLLVVGFYLINIGYVSLALKFGDKPRDLQESIEFLSIKIGLVLVVLGGMHFFNVFNFAKMRRKGTRPAAVAVPPPPLGETFRPNASIEAAKRIGTLHAES
jgi:hypothetical protein